jgi:acetylornithine deacetylase
MMKAEEILKKLVSFDTVGDKENGKIMDWIGEFCVEAGFETEKIGNKKDGRVCLIARAGKSGKNGLIFIGHTDTVAVGGKWDTDPFELKQKKNYLFGLGSADMKGGIAAMLAAVSEVDLSELNKGLELIFTYDEENNFDGIKSVVEKHDLSADCILIGEPTSLEPVVATKGVMVFRIDFVGKDAHGIHPEVGVNAIEMATDFIIELKEYFKMVEKNRNPIFDVPSATLNIAKINGGDVINKVPSACSLEFESRIIDNKQGDKFKEDITALIEKNGYEAKVKADFLLPVSMCRSKEFILTVEEVAKKKAIGVSYATEASFLPGSKNFVILGPGSIKVAHRANEYTSGDSLNGAVGIYKELINTFCA